MCTAIVEIVEAEGAAKNGKTWFGLSHAVVSYDHPSHAMLTDSIILDFVDAEQGPGARAAAELSLDSAKALRAALDRAIAAAEIEEAEHRGPRLRATAA